MGLKAKGKGSGADVILLDKTAPGAGASGIACGCVQNMYLTEPLHAILRHSVDVWTYDAVAFGHQQVGYISAGEANQIGDYERMVANHNAVGYDTDLYVGKDARNFLKSIWPDFKTDGIDVCHHEKMSGYAGTAQPIRGLTQKCIDHGVRIFSGVEVIGYDQTGKTVSAVHTNKGDIKVDAVVWGLGAWTPDHWAMLQRPSRITCTYANEDPSEKDMWTYWRLLEGEVYTDVPYRGANDRDAPVLHVELMNTPVVDQATGKELGDNMYVYW